MGCFLACFGSSKDKKGRNRQSNRAPSGDRDQRKGYNPVEQFSYLDERFGLVEKVALPGEDAKPVQQAGTPKEGKLNSPESLISMFQNKGEDEFSAVILEPVQQEASPKKINLASPRNLSSRSGEKFTDNLSLGENKEVSFDSVVKTHDPVASCEEFSEKEKVESLVKSSKSNLLLEAGSKISSLGSYPPSHRYLNCRESDEEEVENEEGDMDVDENDSDMEEEDEYSDSLSSMESMTKISPVDEISPEVNGRIKKTEATNFSRVRAYDQSILSPVENLSQWKALKAMGKPLQHQKENSALDLQGPPAISFSIEPCFNEAASLKSVPRRDQQTQPMAVDASLSNWLTSPEPINKSRQEAIAYQNFVPQQTMSQGSYSPKSSEDRPILGALTVEELKLMSRTSSPRRSPTKSPDDMAIIGSVGSYWSRTESDKDPASVSSYKGIPNTTSKYQEDKKVSWHSTPFEARLEKALSRGSAQA